ncbi:hypothetical protein Tco_0214115 [Tanacetum coccineum]
MMVMMMEDKDPEKAHEARLTNPEPMKEDQTGSNSGKLHVSLAGSNPEHMDDEFLFSWIKPGCCDDVSMHISDPESEHSEQSLDDIPMQDEGNVSDIEDIDNAHIPKRKLGKYIPTTYKVPEKQASKEDDDIGHHQMVACRHQERKNSAKAGLEGPAFNLLKAFIRPTSSLQYQMDECYKLLTNKVFEKYGYNYLREIILRRADYQEYKISEKDFKNLHPNDFEDLFLLNIQEKLNHLPKTDKTSLHTAVNMWIRNLVIRNRMGDLQLGIESYQTKINLERPNWDAADYYFKEDYTIVPKPRAVVYRDRNDQRKLMRLNELHKFSDGTLTRVNGKTGHMDNQTFICSVQ